MSLNGYYKRLICTIDFYRKPGSSSSWSVIIIATKLLLFGKRFVLSGHLPTIPAWYRVVKSESKLWIYSSRQSYTLFYRFKRRLTFTVVFTNNTLLRYMLTLMCSVVLVGFDWILLRLIRPQYNLTYISSSRYTLLYFLAVSISLSVSGKVNLSVILYRFERLNLSLLCVTHAHPIPLMRMILMRHNVPKIFSYSRLIDR